MRADDSQKSPLNQYISDIGNRLALFEQLIYQAQQQGNDLDRYLISLMAVIADSEMDHRVKILKAQYPSRLTRGLIMGPHETFKNNLKKMVAQLCADPSNASPNPKIHSLRHYLQACGKKLKAFFQSPHNAHKKWFALEEDFATFFKDCDLDLLAQIFVAKSSLLFREPHSEVNETKPLVFYASLHRAPSWFPVILQKLCASPVSAKSFSPEKARAIMKKILDSPLYLYRLRIYKQVYLQLASRFFETFTSNDIYNTLKQALTFYKGQPREFALLHKLYLDVQALRQNKHSKPALLELAMSVEALGNAASPVSKNELKPFFQALKHLFKDEHGVKAFVKAVSSYSQQDLTDFTKVARTSLVEDDLKALSQGLFRFKDVLKSFVQNDSSLKGLKDLIDTPSVHLTEGVLNKWRAINLNGFDNFVNRSRLQRPKQTVTFGGLIQQIKTQFLAPLEQFTTAMMPTPFISQKAVFDHDVSLEETHHGLHEMDLVQEVFLSKDSDLLMLLVQQSDAPLLRDVLFTGFQRQAYGSTPGVIKICENKYFSPRAFEYLFYKIMDIAQNESKETRKDAFSTLIARCLLDTHKISPNARKALLTIADEWPANEEKPQQWEKLRTLLQHGPVSSWQSFKNICASCCCFFKPSSANHSPQNKAATPSSEKKQKNNLNPPPFNLHH